jgi:hypothetical protein
LLYTPLVLRTNLSGGCDVTAEVRSLLQARNQESGVKSQGQSADP